MSGQYIINWTKYSSQSIFHLCRRMTFGIFQSAGHGVCDGIIDRHQIVSTMTFPPKINRLSRWDKSWYDKLKPQFREAFTTVSMTAENDQLEQARWSE